MDLVSDELLEEFEMPEGFCPFLDNEPLSDNKTS
jgi:hypothetical protein